MHISCISDTHIGQDGINPEHAISALKYMEMRSDVIVLNGDILDLWRSSFDGIYREHREFLYLINSISEVTPTIWLRGNHDYSVPQKSFPSVYFADHVDLDGVHFEHGYRFDWSQVDYTWAYKYMPAVMPALYQMFKKSPVAQGIGSVPELLPMHRRAIIYSILHGVSVCVGHSHKPHIEYVSNGRHLIDCGDMVNSMVYVEIVDGEPRMVR